MDTPPAHSTPGRIDREKLLKQRSLVVWLTGLSGAGKTTLAHALQSALHAAGHLCAVVDGDAIRSGLNHDLGFSESDRTENIRRIAQVARLLIDTGVIAIVSVISPAASMRALARSIVGQDDFLEVYVRCPLEVCCTRDVKGLYRRAQAGQLPHFTGISAPYEPPSAPGLILDTDRLDLPWCCQCLFDAVINRSAAITP
jgi:adenylylsulfate kinase